MRDLIFKNSKWLAVGCLIAVPVFVYLLIAASDISISYWLWKYGLYPADSVTIASGLRTDRNALQLVVGKTEAELRETFGDVHPPTASFDLLISKQLGAPRRGDSYLQWAENYIIFELKNGRAVALRFVSG